MNNLFPLNRHVLIERAGKDNSEESTAVLVPEGYKKEERYGTYRVLATAPNCITELHEGDCVVVPNSMVEEITIQECGTHRVILENHIIGVYNTQ